MNKDYQTPSALRWNRLACDAIYYTKTPPTRAARALAMVHTAMYDAWTCYSDGPQISTTTGDRLKRPPEEYTRENREIAFSFAAYRVLVALFGDSLPADQKRLFAKLMEEISCKIDDVTCDPTKPQGIGNLSAKLILESRRGDGSNQEAGYADYSGYTPKNEPQGRRPMKSPGNWQPQLEQPSRIPQKFLTPHWGLVKPFALTWGGQFRPPPPVPYGTCEFKQQVEDIIRISECLTEEQKLIAEYWAGMHEDKFPDSVSIPNFGYWLVPPAQCCRIARYIAAKNDYKNANVIKLYFALTNALFDASIAAWDAKVHYDSCRPDSVIHENWDNKTLRAWGGSCEGTVSMQGENWLTYLPSTPPFAEFPSGHSTFSRAMAEIITCFCGDNSYGESITIPKQGSVIESACSPEKEMTLHWRTLHEAAEQAGISRRYGGIHFEQGDLRGRELGRNVANCVWEKVCRYFDGVPS